MIPNTKKIRDNAIKVSVDYYDHAVLTAHAERSGVELATLVRQLAMSKLHDLMFRDQPIAMLLPASNTVQMPSSHFWAMTQSPTSHSEGATHAP